MNIIWVFSVLLSILVGTFSFSVSAEDLEPKGITCKEIVFEKEDIIDIVKRVRAANPKLPPKIENGNVRIHRNRCHYVYTETPRVGDAAYEPRVVVINEVGEIVDFIEGRSAESSLMCPEIEYSDEKVADFLRLSRKKFLDIPVRPKDFTSRVYRMRCMYVYYEIPTSDEEGKGYKYIFDHHGDLFDFRAMD